MRLANATQALRLLALAGVCFVGEAQSRQRITVRTYKTNYMIDTWDDGRDEPYVVTYWKFGLNSVYTFDAAGHVRTLTAGDTLRTFDFGPPSRMLVTSDDDATREVDADVSPLIACSTCETTWDTLCSVGLVDVCFLGENNPDDFDDDAEDSVRRFCSAVGAACETSAAEICIGMCVEGEM